MNILFVFVGSGLGGTLRYLISHAVNSRTQASPLWGTLLVNVLACFIIGLIMGALHHKGLLSRQHYLLLVTGFCGGFSTFSAITSETLALYAQHPIYMAALYLVGTIVLGVGANLLGLYLGR